MTFTVFTKDNIGKYFDNHQSPWYNYICAFQSVKSADNGIAGHGSHNDLVGTVGDFSLLWSYKYVPPPLKECKEYSYASLTFNIPRDI